MFGTLAVSALAMLLGQVSADVELEARVEARTTTLAGTNLPRLTATAYAVMPGAKLLTRSGELRLSVGYAPVIWSSDVVGDPAPVVNHRAETLLEVGNGRTWRAVASAAGARGWTDPLADLRSVSAAAGQVGIAQKTHVEDLRTELRSELKIDERTRAGASLAWAVTRAVDPMQRGVLPTQRSLMAGSTLSRALTELDSAQLGLSGQRIRTDAMGGTVQTAFAALTVAWDRKLTPQLQGQLGGGAALVWPDAPGGSYQGLPSATAKLTWSGDSSLGGDLGVGLTTFVDRFTGHVTSILEGTANLNWHLAENLALSATAFAGTRPDGETKLARAEVRLAWALRRGLALDAGVRGWRQVERRPDLPSFTEAAIFVAVVFGPTGGPRGGDGTPGGNVDAQGLGGGGS